MTTQTHNTEKDVVRNLRKIRDEISSEIKDMTFLQQRAYLDKLLAEKDKSEPPIGIAAKLTVQPAPTFRG
jgi:hypothetical protein